MDVRWWCALIAGSLVIGHGLCIEEPEPSFIPGRLLVRFAPEVPNAHARGLIVAAGARSVGILPQIGIHVVELPDAADETAYARFLEAQPEVEFAELDHIRAMDATPDDPYYSSEWHLPKISAPNAWDSTTGSSQVVIAILDTGVDGTHPDLSSKMLPGWNFLSNNSDTSDGNGHGTAVAGTAAAATNNGVGVASVSWNCLILPVRIANSSGLATDSLIANGLVWAADRGARVANVSYGVTGSSTVTEAAKYFQSKGGVVCVSAGNQGEFKTSGDNPYILTVSATDSGDNLTSWSNRGNNIDLAAPGVNVFTTNRGGGYGSWAGTSFSAPIVAGVAALTLSANPNLTPSQLQDILKKSADDLGTKGWDPYYGWGRVNAAKAVKMALNVDATPPTVNITSPADGATVSGIVTVQVSASDNVKVTAVSLKVDGTLVATDTEVPYTFTGDSSNYDNGTHTLTAIAEDTAGNTASSSVSVKVNNPSDTIPPSVSITSPQSDTTVSSTVAVTVNATDNVKVAKVELYVDGKWTTVSTFAPFTLYWNSKQGKVGSRSLQCRAYDAAGNAATSGSVTVKVKK
jgi:hypothetical protein